MKKFEVGFLVGYFTSFPNGSHKDELFQTVIEFNNEAEAFCFARNKAEKWYSLNGVNCISTENINHKDSYVKICKEVTKSDLLEMFAELETMGL